MSFSPFRKIKVPPNDTPTAKQINDNIDNTAAAFQQILGKDQLDSSIVSNIKLVPGIVNSVPHTLGRNLTGWIVIRNHGIATNIIDLQDTNKSPNLLLNLVVSVKCMVDLLVF